MKPNCYLHALSSYVPAEVLTNDDLSKLVETNDEWITTRTGIKRRHRLPQEENASDLGTHAARKALEDAGLDAAKLTHILTATCTPDHLSPSLSCIIGGNIGAGPAMSFDFGSACSGFLYGLHLADALLCQDPASQILFVCTEALTRRVNWSDRSTCVLFGDGAGAAVFEAVPNVPFASLQGARGGKAILANGPGPLAPRLTMDGRAVFRFAVEAIPRCIDGILTQTHLTLNDIDWVVCHQANERILDHCIKKLHAPAEKFYKNMARYGNTSAASIPIALDEMNEQGLLKPGQTLLCVGFGGGLTWAAALFTL